MAEKANGHVYEDRFMNLNGIKLIVAYQQALRQDSRRLEEIKILEKVLDQKFENLYMFADRELYKAVQEQKELGTYREEIKAEEFPDMWEDILEQIPEAIIAEEPEQDPFANLPKADEDIEEYITGFVPYHSKEAGDE